MSQKIGYIVGSLSKESINRRLAKALARLAPEGVELVDIPIGDLPLYNPTSTPTTRPSHGRSRTPSPTSTA